MAKPSATTGSQPARVQAASILLEADLGVPPNASGIVLFAHGSNSGRHSPRNGFVAQVLRDAGFATLLIDLLTAKEEALDRHTAHLRFDIRLLTERLVRATDWLASRPDTAHLPVGYFGASTGAAAALRAAAERPGRIAAVVCRGGRPDLAGPVLHRVEAATLLIVGGYDIPVMGLNVAALQQLPTGEKQFVVVPGATHLFAEPGTLDTVAHLAADWFTQHLGAAVGGGRGR